MLASAASMSTSLRLRARLLLFHNIHNLVGDAEVFDVVAAHIAFRKTEELVAFGAGLHDFFEGQVHVGVALHQVAVEGFAIFQLDEHGVPLGGGEEAEW